MLKMIIADDEYLVRDSLMNIIPWNNYGIEVIAGAVNGQETYDMCMNLKPDILLTDIRMPIMDGLEVAMKLKEEGSPAKVLLISGIQDFSYAKTALDVDAEGYILKPIKLDELEATIHKIVNRIKLERNTQTKIHELREQLRENSSFAREKFLRNLIKGIFKDEEEIINKVSYFDLPFKSGNLYIVATCQIDRTNTDTWDSSEENKQLLSFAISNIITEILDNYKAGISFCSDENTFIIIFNQMSQNTNKCPEICDEIISCVNKSLETSLSIGIGRYVNKLAQLNLSYKDSMSALQFKFYTGQNSILDIDDINCITDVEQVGGIPESLDTHSVENELSNYIKLGNKELALQILDDVFDNILGFNNVAISYVQSLCVELIFIISGSSSQLDDNITDLAGSRTETINRIYSMSTIYELKEYLQNLIIKVTEHFSSKYIQKNTNIINKVKDIIQRHYPEDINVSRIAGEVYMSPNYIGLIFKQETGKSITEYITQTRMEAAKELLKNSSSKILEIAELVGYDNPQYFSTIFKKYYGVHPNQFRTMHSG